MSAPAARKRAKAVIAKPTDVLDPANCIFRHVTRTSRAVAAVYDAAFAQVGLTGHQFDLLVTIQRNGPNTVGRIALYAGLSPTSVPRNAAAMIKKGWLAVDHGKDRRERILAVTAAGRKKLAQALPVWRAVQGSILHEFGAVNWRNCMAVLKSMRDDARTVAQRRA